MRPELKAGDVLGETYRLVELIGKGGMGEVWKAEHQRLPKKVAVKVLLDATLANETAIARFRREAEIASRLNHPNIVDILDFNTLPGGIPYMVLELLDGESLRSRLRKGPMSLPEALRILRQVSSALVEAHGKGVVHRDLKPENIHLVPEMSESGLVERAKVLDFGISKLQGGETALTQESEVLGTPVYMAPEQVSGSQGQIDGRTDQFALGSIFYEMVTGSVAFSGNTVIQVLGRVLQGEPEPIEGMVPGIPQSVSAAVKKALAKKPEDRFKTVVEFVETMASGLTGAGYQLQTGPHARVNSIAVAATMASGPGQVSGGFRENVEMAADLGTQPTLHSTQDELEEPAARDLGTQPTMFSTSDKQDDEKDKETGPEDDPAGGFDRYTAKRRDIPPTRPVDKVTSGLGSTAWKYPVIVAGGLVLGAAIVFLTLHFFPREQEESSSEKMAQKDSDAEGLTHGKKRVEDSDKTAQKKSEHNENDLKDDPGGEADGSSEYDDPAEEEVEETKQKVEEDSKEDAVIVKDRKKERKRPQAPAENDKTIKKGLSPEAEEFLSLARGALKNSNWDQAFRYAERSWGHQRSSAAGIIMVQARCGQKSLGLANAALSRLSGSARRRAIEWCKRRHGMDLE